MQFLRGLKSLDGFVKTKADSVARKRTLCGAIQLGLYFTSDTKSTLTVDQSEGAEHLSIAVDISFWHIPCPDLELEVQDAKGRLYSPKRQHLSKRDLALGAEPSQPGGIGFFSAPQGGVSRPTGKRGCRVYGDVDVNRVAGNVHVVPRAFSAKGGMSMYRGMPIDDLLHYNASHTVHTLRFGPAFPGQENPLEGVTTGSDKPAQFQYFAQVVPTRYQHLSGLVTDANQYSVTQHVASSDPTSPYMVPPGFVLRFDISPIIVTLSSASPGIGKLLTGVCAVIGGVYAVTSLLDKAIHGSIAAVAKVD
ncbi:hypothetical protein FNF28_01487 [Cafeteria roenbergensis]|uniref:Endoplasmic reticulum vesicle transporter C-terminal domain-containing protein n=1 Tax=Cafeteria roenbergensis TaxID=33653 RepID=A0A5A8DY93_CAFRO|nr:hypothetical protein FNF28_01487 [Cafeteria roenbergensis]